MSHITLFLVRHKTKSLGLLMVLAGAFQANIIYIQAMIEPKIYGFICMGLGVTVSILGFLNTQTIEEIKNCASDP